MKFGFNVMLWTTFVQEVDIPVLESLKAIGFDGAEIPVNDGVPADYARTRAWLKDCGLDCTAVGMVTADTDPSSAEDSVRTAALACLRKRIDCAHELGAKVLGGPLYAAHKVFYDDPLGLDASKRAAEVLAQAAEYAETAGITLALEPLNRFEIQLLNTAQQAREVCELVAHPRLGIHYDTHHAHIEERSHADAIATCGRHLAHFHVSESHRGTLGTGMVDWRGAADALGATDYDAWIVVEAFGTAVDGLRQAANVHRDCYETREDLAQRSLPFLRELFG